MNAKINFNGQEYNNPDEMPLQIRQLYERAMANLSQEQHTTLASPNTNIKLKTNLRFKYNGQTYDSLEELPQEVRARYENVVNQMDKDQNGIPDFLEGKSEMPAAFSQHIDDTKSDAGFIPSAPLAPIGSQTSPVIQPDSSSKQILLLSGIVIVLLLLTIAVLFGYIYLR